MVIQINENTNLKKQKTNKFQIQKLNIQNFLKYEFKNLDIQN